MSYKNLNFYVLFISIFFFTACSSTALVSAQDDDCDNSFNFKSDISKEDRNTVLQYNEITNSYKFKDSAQ